MRRRTALGAALLLSVLSFLSFASLASADAPNVEGIIYFYSDETYSTQVGYIWWTCSGRSQEGTITAFSIPENPFFECGSYTPIYCYYDVVFYCIS